MKISNRLAVANETATEGELEEIGMRARAAVERMGEFNRNLDPDEVYREVTAAVEEVRQARYEAEQRAKVQSGH